MAIWRPDIWRGTLLATLMLACAVKQTAYADPRPPRPPGDHGIDWPMDDDPRMAEIPHHALFHPKLKGFWKLALDRPEPGLRAQALSAVAFAHAMGMPGLADFAPRIRAMLTDAKQEPEIRHAAAHALVALDFKAAGPELLEANRPDELEMVLETDPALARWKVAGAEDLWISRLKDASVPDQQLCSAMRSLATTRTAAAADPLRSILVDPHRSISTRSVAAESVAAIAPANAAETARTLAAGESLEDRLLAVLSLPDKPDAKGVELLVTLAQDSEAAVASVAVHKLLIASPDSLAPLVNKLTNHSDAIVRQNIVSVLQRHADAPNILLLGQLLNDKAPKVREAAREALIAVDANESLRPHVRALALDRLNNGTPADWRAIEQAALIVGSLHENSARDRCVALLRHPQWQVRIAAIVALRRLQLPETLTAQFERAREVAAEFKNPPAAKAKARPNPEELSQRDEEIAQLLQNLGLVKMQESLSFIHEFIPKGSGWAESARTAAIWATGKIQEGSADKRISRQLVDRMQDEDPQHPESPDVRVMSAITLARIKDKSVESALRQTVKNGGFARLAEAAKWALANLEGTPYNGPEPIDTVITDWFLEPMN